MQAYDCEDMPPETLALIPRGAVVGGYGQTMSQAEGVLAAKIAELAAEVRELRKMLAPDSTVILTGSEVAAHAVRLGIKF